MCNQLIAVETHHVLSTGEADYLSIFDSRTYAPQQYHLNEFYCKYILGNSPTDITEFSAHNNTVKEPNK